MTESYGIEIIGDKKIKKGAGDLLQNNDKYTVRKYLGTCARRDRNREIYCGRITRRKRIMVEESYDLRESL